MKTSDYILLALGIGVAVIATILFSKPIKRVTEPKFGNIRFGVDLGRSLGIV